MAYSNRELGELKAKLQAILVTTPEQYVKKNLVKIPTKYATLITTLEREVKSSTTEYKRTANLVRIKAKRLKKDIEEAITKIDKAIRFIESEKVKVSTWREARQNYGQDRLGLMKALRTIAKKVGQVQQSVLTTDEEATLIYTTVAKILKDSEELTRMVKELSDNSEKEVNIEGIAPVVNYLRQITIAMLNGILPVVDARQLEDPQFQELVRRILPAGTTKQRYEEIFTRRSVR
jgi:hypothetical protein